MAPPIIAIGPGNTTSVMVGVVELPITRGSARAMALVRTGSAAVAPGRGAPGVARIVATPAEELWTARTVDVHPVIALATLSRVAPRTEGARC